MTALKAGDNFPEGVDFRYALHAPPAAALRLLNVCARLSWVPYTEEKESLTSCGIPQTYHASKEFADKKVVLFAVPGAFTPGCSVNHLPGYIEHLNEIKDKGVDLVIVIACNDAWVMSAWGKANAIKNDNIVSLRLAGLILRRWLIGGQMFMSDTGISFSKSIGWTRGADRTGRYAMVIDHGKIVYAENEPAGDVTVWLDVFQWP